MGSDNTQVCGITGNFTFTLNTLSGNMSGGLPLIPTTLEYCCINHGDQ